MDDLKNKYVIFSDFDGTITQKDSTVELVNKFGGKVNRDAENLYIAGKANNREVISLHYSTLNLSVQKYYEVIHSMPLDPSFRRFYETLGSMGIKIHVITGSIARAIKDYFYQAGFADIAVHGNRMRIKNGRVLFSPAHKIENTLCLEGCCANCKSAWVEKYHHRNKKIIYIGDGLTDTCVSGYADLLFAKDSLARYCEKQKMNFVPFNNFGDIHQYLFGS